jgi:predicted transcriptional regulator
MTASKANKLTKTQRSQVRALIAKMDRRGFGQFDIQDALLKEGFDLSQPMISVYLKKIREDYKRQEVEDRAAKVRAKLEEYRDIRREAWLAYDRSQKDTFKEQSEYAISEDEGLEGSEQRIKRIVTIEGRLPENAYLTTIMNTLKAERELLGLDETKDRTITLEQALELVRAFKEAAKDVLGQHPDLLRALQQRTIQIVPVPIESKPSELQSRE